MNRFKYLMFFLAFTVATVAKAQIPTTPPPPPSDTPGPGLPINESIFILVFVAVFFGSYVVFKKLKNKQV